MEIKTEEQIIKILSDEISIIGTEESVKNITLGDIQNLEIPVHWRKEKVLLTQKSKQEID